VNELETALAYLARQHPRWSVAPTEQGQRWQAVARPTASSVHVVVKPTLRELAFRLEELDWGDHE
jgi:hypothetical protein